jgi:hypothetical protein
VLEFEPVKVESDKLQQLLRSRRFWAVVLSISATIAIEGFGFKADQVEHVNQVIMVVVSVYIGGLSLEDALKQLGGLDKLLGGLAELVGKKK